MTTNAQLFADCHAGSHAGLMGRLVIEQFVDAQPSEIRDGLQRVGRGDAPAQPCPHCRLANTAPPSELSLGDTRLVEVLPESFHIANIGDSDILSIGRSYTAFLQTSGMKKTPEIRTFYERVKEAMTDAARQGRTFNGVKIKPTQVMAAKLAGVAQPSVAEWNEPGKAPKLQNVLKLAERLGVCVEWLYTERGPKHPGIAMDEMTEQLLDVWSHLNEIHRRDLLGYLRMNLPSPFLAPSRI